MDQDEIATQFEMEERERQIAAQRALLKQETHPDFDGEHCVDCDVPIPQARLEMGKVRCTHCQRVKEVRSRLYGGLE